MITDEANQAIFLNLWQQTAVHMYHVAVSCIVYCEVKVCMQKKGSNLAKQQNRVWAQYSKQIDVGHQVACS